MDDLISRQAALKAVAFDTEAYMAVNMLPSAQQWILCSESLPEEGENVLITDEDGYVVLADYTRYSWEADPIVWYSDGCHVTPVAWCPLPDPYKGEDNG